MFARSMIHNLSQPFVRATSFVWQPRRDAFELAVICKATYRVMPGSAEYHDVPEELHELQLFQASEVSRGVYCPSDIVPPKRMVDVLLVGHTKFAPDRVLSVGVSVGVLSRRVVMHGGRSLEEFGPLPSRYGVAGWSRADWHARPLGDDAERAAFNVAPANQRLQSIELSEDSQFSLFNLVEGSGPGPGILPILSTYFHGELPYAVVQSPDCATRWVDMRCDTLWIDVDRRIFALTWRASATLSGPTVPNATIVGMARPEERPSLSELEARVTTKTLELTGAMHLQAPSAPTVIGTGTIGGHAPPHAAEPPPPRPSERVAPSAASDHRMTIDPFNNPFPITPFLGGGGSGHWGTAALPPPPITIVPIVPSLAGRAAEEKRTIGQDIAGSLTRVVSVPLEPQPMVADVGPGASAPSSIDLVWFDARALPRVRNHAPWKELLASAKLSPEYDHLADEGPAPARVDVKDRRDVALVLSRGEALHADHVAIALDRAIKADAAFLPPMVLVEGELVLQFDALETLKATIAAVSPHLGGDADLAAVVGDVNEIFKKPWVHTANGVVEELTARIRDVFAGGQRRRPDAVARLDLHVTRALVEHRRYRTATILGRTRLCALVTSRGASTQVAAYLPEGVGKDLPGFERFAVRVVAEVRAQMDAYAKEGAALRVVALGRRIE